jgi:hypothetical protein
MSATPAAPGGRLALTGLTVLRIAEPDLEHETRLLAFSLALSAATGHRPPACPLLPPGPAVSVLYLAAVEPPETITEMIDQIASGTPFPSHEARLTVRDARELMLWLPSGQARLATWIDEVKAEMLVVDTVQAAAGGLAPVVLAETMDALRLVVDRGTRVLVLDYPHLRERERLGSWTLPSGNSCDVCCSAETGIAIAWAQPPSPAWSREDQDYYTQVLRPAIAARVAEHMNQRVLLVDPSAHDIRRTGR